MDPWRALGSGLEQPTCAKVKALYRLRLSSPQQHPCLPIISAGPITHPLYNPTNLQTGPTSRIGKSFSELLRDPGSAAFGANLLHGSPEPQWLLCGRYDGEQGVRVIVLAPTPGAFRQGSHTNAHMLRLPEKGRSRTQRCKVYCGSYTRRLAGTFAHLRQKPPTIQRSHPQ